MLGRNHVITNLALAPIAAWSWTHLWPHTLTLMSKLPQPVQEPILTVTRGALNMFGLPTMVTPSTWFDNIGTTLAVLCSAVFYVVGSLLPDIDSPNSLLGRYVHLPVRHRTWTHTVWFLIPLYLMGLVWHPFTYLALGATFHIWLDALSTAGICWFYPLSRYRHITEEISVKDKHPIRLYRTGATAEYILMSVIIAITALICISPFIHL